MKKIILSLATISSVAAPTIAVVSCGNNDSIDTKGYYAYNNKNDKGVSKGGLVLTFDGKEYFVPEGSTKVIVIRDASASEYRNRVGVINRDDKHAITENDLSRLRLNDSSSKDSKITNLSPASIDSYGLITKDQNIKYYANLSALQTAVLPAASGSVSKEEAIKIINEVVSNANLKVKSLNYVAKTTSAESSIKNVILEEK